VKDIDDRGYTWLFSNKEIFRQLVTSFVEEEWVKDLDFSNCELVPGVFISPNYEKTFSDLMYKVKLRGRDFYIVILLEFKSAPAPFVAVQVLGYILDFYRHLIASEKDLRKLPPVFPIMLYNGEKSWTTPLDISELIEGHEILGDFALHFKCFPIIEYTYAEELLLKIGNIVATLFLAEVHYDFDLLANQLLTLFDRTEDKQAISLFLNWLKQMAIYEKIDESHYREFERIYYERTEVNMLENAIRKEKKQIREQGWVDGKSEGEKEGKLKVAKMMLQNGEPIEKIRLYTGLSDEQIRELQKELQPH
jgi:predicted transposase/invertase (TIGR01784 family)